MMAFLFAKQEHYKQPLYGNGTTYSGDYQAHNSNVKRVNTPLPNRYPGAIRDDTGSAHEDADGTIPIEFHGHHMPGARGHQRARFVDPVESPNGDQRNMSKLKEDKGGIIRSVDDAADGYIKAKHRAFELRQYSTFKM